MKVIKKLSLEELDKVTNDPRSIVGGQASTEANGKSLPDIKLPPVLPAYKDIGDIGVNARFNF